MKLNKLADLYALSKEDRNRLMDSLESLGYVTATQSEIGIVIMEEIDAEETTEE